MKRDQRRLLIALGLGLFLAWAIVCEVLTSIRRAAIHKEERMFLPDIMRVGAVCQTIPKIYAFDGHLMDSIPEFERSAFYPFKEMYDRSCSNSTLSIEVRPMDGQYRCEAIYRSGSPAGHFAAGDFPKETPKVATRLMIGTYISGYTCRSKAIQGIRADFQYTHTLAMSRADPRTRPCPLVFTLKEEPKLPFQGDYPLDQQELHEYIQWLEATDGVNELLDGWGHRLTFSVDAGTFECCSAGEDGILGTGDDICSEIRLPPRASLPSSGI